jgi:hypothetical protein
LQGHSMGKSDGPRNIPKPPDAGSTPCARVFRGYQKARWPTRQICPFLPSSEGSPVAPCCPICRVRR